MTHHILAEHGQYQFIITYRNRNIVSIIRHSLSDLNPRGREIPYDSLSLPERESILISIIEYLNNNNEN